MIRTMKSRSDRKPKRYTRGVQCRPMCIRVDVDEYAYISAMAEQRGASVSAVFRDILADWRNVARSTWPAIRRELEAGRALRAALHGVSLLSASDDDMRKLDAIEAAYDKATESAKR